MSIRHVLSILLFATNIPFMLAQQAQQPDRESPFIEVRGEAEMEVEPDMIFIEIFIRERYDGRQKITIEEQEKNLKEKLTRNGIDLSQLQISNAQAQFEWVKWSTKDVIAQKTYTLMLNKAAQIGTVFAVLDELNLREAHIGRVDHSKRDSLQKVMRIKAIQTAKNKANYLLEAIGESAGKPLVIREEVDPNYRLRNEQMMGLQFDRLTYSNMDEQQEIGFRKIKISSLIYIKFQIK